MASCVTYLKVSTQYTLSVFIGRADKHCPVMLFSTQPQNTGSALKYTKCSRALSVLPV